MRLIKLNWASAVIELESFADVKQAAQLHWFDYANSFSTLLPKILVVQTWRSMIFTFSNERPCSGIVVQNCGIVFFRIYKALSRNLFSVCTHVDHKSHLLTVIAAEQTIGTEYQMQHHQWTTMVFTVLRSKLLLF